MRSIYATLVALLLILTTGVTGFSQRNAKSKDIVTRTIIGCTLGESTIEQIKKTIQEQNGTIRKIEDGIEGSRVQEIYANDLPFFGKNRNAIMLKTVDGVLYMVGFLIGEKDEANRLKFSLSDKYKDWQHTHIDASDAYLGGVDDDKSQIMLSYENDSTYGGDFKYALLIYWDKALAKKVLEIERTDL